MIHNSLFQFLKNNAIVVSIVGDRVYHEWAPQTQTTFPYLVFQLVSRQEVALDMEAPDDAKIERENYQFDFYARNSADAISAADSFDSLFRNFRGTMGAVDVQEVQLSNSTHLGEKIGDKQVRRVSSDYAISYNISEA